MDPAGDHAPLPFLYLSTAIYCPIVRRRNYGDASYWTHGASGPDQSEAPALLQQPGAREEPMTAPTPPIVAPLPTPVAPLSAPPPGAACRIERGARLVAADAVSRIARVWI